MREGKGTTFEGGQRVPCVMWGPGRIPAGTESDELVGTIDLLPTIAALTDSSLPADREIDGLDASVLLASDEAGPRDEFLYYTSRGVIEGMRQGKWKLLVKKPQPQGGARKKGGRGATPAEEVMLFDLSSDIGEATNLAEGNPEVVERLRLRMGELDAAIEAKARAPWLKDEA